MSGGSPAASVAIVLVLVSNSPRTNWTLSWGFVLLYCCTIQSPRVCVGCQKTTDPLAALTGAEDDAAALAAEVVAAAVLGAAAPVPPQAASKGIAAEAAANFPITASNCRRLA